MKRVFIAIALAVIILGPVSSIAAPSLVIPTFSITAVSEDISVTILTSNFPAGDSFTVTMGAYGTKGVGGYVVGTQSSGAGGSFSATYSIPAQLWGSEKIAIRLQSPSSGYYSYNWFWNNDHPSSPSPPGVGYPPLGSGTIPSTTITNVVTDTSVSAAASNFTTNDVLNVYIGAFGTKGVGGAFIGTQPTSASGTFTGTYTIPAAYHGSNKLAIRWVSPSLGYYAYDWFVNDASSPSSPSSPPAGPGTIPSTTITSVVEDTSVTASGSNFPTNDTLNVYIGAFGTKGVGGTLVGTQPTSASGTFTATYLIPAGYHGSYKLAIRWESQTTAYYAYDWFVNSPSAAPSVPPVGPVTIPTFTIIAVNEDNTVTISAINFIPNDTYTVLMGLFGTKAVGGTWVASHSTGPVGTFTATYNIPAGLYGLDRIAIRLQSPTSGYYSYNWFWNADHP